MPIKDYKELSEKEKKKILSEITKNANADQRKVMPIKKECTICKVRHPEHPKLINVKEFEEKYTQSIEEEEWEDKLNEKFRDLRDEYPEKFSDIEQFIKSLLLSKEEEWKREQEILINTIIATLKK